MTMRPIAISTEKPTMCRSAMLSTMGRSSRRGGATRPHQAVVAKRTMVAIAVRSATDQRGGKLWRITLFTGQVMPHVSTTAPSSTAARRRDTPPCASSGAGRMPFRILLRVAELGGGAAVDDDGLARHEG